MITSVSKQAYVVQRKYPFLENFPFNEFQVEAGDLFKPMAADDSPYPTQTVDPKLLKFVYETDQSSMTIMIFEQELNWLNEIAEKITALDHTTKVIDEAINSTDLLTKRDGVNFAEEWSSKIQDNRTRLSYSTSGEILSGLVRSHAQLTEVINKLVKLALGKGLVGLDREEYQIILTYYQFQLIYTKLILGIVIASKISI
jgi:hypothetical protein